MYTKQYPRDKSNDLRANFDTQIINIDKQKR